MATKDISPYTKKRIISLLRKHDVIRAGIFGSYARGEATKSSDIDILVKYKKRKSLFDLVRLERELAASLGTKIDLLTYKSINPLLRERILREEKRLI